MSVRCYGLVFSRGIRKCRIRQSNRINNYHKNIFLENYPKLKFENIIWNFISNFENIIFEVTR